MGNNLLNIASSSGPFKRKVRVHLEKLLGVQAVTLHFYYKGRGQSEDQLVASAHIPENGNEGYPWPDGQIEFHAVKLEQLPGDLSQWKTDGRFFRETLQSELRKHIVVTGRATLKPWTRLAFENIHKYGLRRYSRFACARLFEDDGTEFDPAQSISLYPGMLTDPREPFSPGGDHEKIAADQALLDEMRTMAVYQRTQSDPALNLSSAIAGATISEWKGMLPHEAEVLLSNRS